MFKDEGLRHKGEQFAPFPFDGTVANIVQTLHGRDFSKLGIRTEYSHGDLNTIEGENFRIGFCREQVSGGGLTGASELVIPQQQLNVYGDNSGPTYYRYAGDNWNRDKHAFTHNIKVNSKLYGKPRTYLLYKGAWRPQGRDNLFGGALILQQPFEHGMAPYLVHDNNLGREYELEKRDSPYYETQKVMQEFNNWLRTNVLKPLTDLPSR